MRILIVGGTGTIGRTLSTALAADHEVFVAGRSGPAVSVDITSADSIEKMFRQVGPGDACICVAASGAMDRFADLDEHGLLENMKGKLFGQMNLVLIGQRYLADKGSFTLTSGIFADEAWPGVTGGAVISGALHSFVLSAALELPRGLRINAVSPGMVDASIDQFGHLFPGMKPVAMDRLVAAYMKSVEGASTGQILRVYG